MFKRCLAWPIRPLGACSSLAWCCSELCTHKSGATQHLMASSPISAVQCGERNLSENTGVLLHLEINSDKFQNMTCGDHLACLTIREPPCVINTTSALCALHIIVWEPLMKPHVCLPFTRGYEDPESLPAFVPSYPASVPGSFCSLLF